MDALTARAKKELCRQKMSAKSEGHVIKACEDLIWSQQCYLQSDESHMAKVRAKAQEVLATCDPIFHDGNFSRN